MLPIVCMVTDRGLFGRDAASAEERLVVRVAVAARAGVDLIQVRERDMDGGPLTRLVRRCVEAVRGTSARVLVNDRFDVALAAGAHGVHLRGASMPASRVRELSPPGFVIGRAVHGMDEAVRVAAQGGLDYLMFGTVFPSPSKPSSGVDGLRQVAAAIALPVLAVGGMTPATFGAAARAGASGFAAIRCFAEADDEQVRTSMAALHAAYS